MENIYYFLCKVIKPLDNDELNKSEDYIKERIKSFLPETFVIAIFAIKDEKATAICVCSNEDDYEYILSRTSLEIKKI